MLKVCHLADVHFRGLTRHAEYKKAFQDAFRKMEKLKPDVILIAGDIVHSKTQGISPELIDILAWWFRSLGDIAPTHVTLGNHDGLLLNADREDAISPIVRAISHPNIFLHKKTQVVKLAEGYNLCVFSCFDEVGWKDLRPVPGEINIATFHGAVSGSTTDEEWKIDGGVNVDFFKDYDFVMLGDIHKCQTLDAEGRVKYSGSVLQQNYGESQEKGFLFWVIEDRNDFDSRFVQVKNDCPFVTIDYHGDIDDLLSKAEAYPPTSRFRIRLQEHINAGEMSQIKGALKSNLKPTEIVFKQEQVHNTTQLLPSEKLEVSTFEDANALVLDFHAGNNISDKTKETMTELLKNAWMSAKIDDTNKGGKFHVKKLEFDNIFGYGEGNVVNFDAAEGITGIFGKNRSGKSSICGALAYGLYNGTDRGPMKNMYVVNARKNFCNVKVNFSKAGVDYLAERQTVKVSNKHGTWGVTDLNLFEIDPHTEQKRDLSEEQRRETEKVLRDLVGNLEDFLLTSLSSQGNVNKFIELNAAARKAYLARFLKLDMFEKLEASLKEEIAVTKRLLETVPEKEFDAVIADFENKLKARTQERADLIISLDTTKTKLDALSQVLSSQASETYTKSEIAQQQKELAATEKRLAEAKNKATELQDKIAATVSVKADLAAKIDEIDEADINKKIAEKNDVSKAVEKSEQQLEIRTNEIKRDEAEVKKLSDVPCGDAFPKCKYIVSAKSAKTTLEKKYYEHSELKATLTALQKSYATLLKEAAEEKLKSLKTLNEQVSAIELDRGRLELELSRAQTNIDNLVVLIATETKKLERMQANACDDSVAEEREKLLTKKKKLENEMHTTQTHITKLSEQIGTMTAQLAQTKKEKGEFEIRSHKSKALKFLSKALSKNGVPLSIVRKRLPQINAELANILQAAVGFTIELVSDEDTNDMDIYIDYGDSRRIVEVGSGMEKMISSIALRAALINVSNLPKSDIFIIDEGFGALDGKNLEVCSALLRELTKHFKSIIVISHVDTIKDVVDNVIEIDCRGIDSHVCFD